MLADWPNECRTYSLYRQFNTLELPLLVQQLRNEIEPYRIIQTLQTFITYVSHVPETAHLLVSLNIIPILTAFISQTNDLPHLSSVEVIASDLLHMLASRAIYTEKESSLATITNPLESLAQSSDISTSCSALHSLSSLVDLDPLFPQSMFAGNLFDRAPTLLSSKDLNPAILSDLLFFITNLIRNAEHYEDISCLENVLQTLSNIPDAVVRDKAQTALINYRQKAKTLRHQSLTAQSYSSGPQTSSEFINATGTNYGYSNAYDSLQHNSTHFHTPSPPNKPNSSPHIDSFAINTSMSGSHDPYSHLQQQYPQNIGQPSPPTTLLPYSKQTYPIASSIHASDATHLSKTRTSPTFSRIVDTMFPPKQASQTKLNVFAEDYTPLPRSKRPKSSKKPKNSSSKHDTSTRHSSAQYSLSAREFVPKGTEEQEPTPYPSGRSNSITEQNQELRLPSNFHLLSFNPSGTLVNHSIGSINTFRTHGLFVPSTLISSGKWLFEAIFDTDFQKRIGIIQSSFSPPHDYFPGKTTHSVGYSGSGVVDHQQRFSGNDTFGGNERISIEVDLTGPETVMAFFVNKKEQKMKVKNIPKEFRFCVYIHREFSSVKILTLEEIEDTHFSLSNSAVLDWNDNSVQ
ncbi:hypothetical protein BLNAU_18167 [Blattamonas nauphoetae]|uniref:SPRY domain-containing protein n=1 Tax=Blattamonas nauphoetae TaxID=2049346 RepID=A0ABQ9X517_9EUKA|nr:hypothetical protein BLNAU_18167 [Blattamonas nauphoetae]